MSDSERIRGMAASRRQQASTYVAHLKYIDRALGTLDSPTTHIMQRMLIVLRDLVVAENYRLENEAQSLIALAENMEKDALPVILDSEVGTEPEGSALN